MEVVLDIECNGLHNPNRIWIVICKDIATGTIYKFRDLTKDTTERERFIYFIQGVSRFIGHNIVEYDIPVLRRLLGCDISSDKCLDTLIVSRLTNYSLDGGHSLEAWGERFGLSKIEFKDFSKFTPEMEEYCGRDVEISHLLYNHFHSVITDKHWASAIDLEHRFQLIVNDLHTNGFGFNEDKAKKLLGKVSDELVQLDEQIHLAFPPRVVVVRSFTPRATKHGTISRTSVPRSLWDNIHNYVIGETYDQTKLEPFNPSSHKQLIEVLNDAGWKPEDRTTTHTTFEREYNRAKSTGALADPEVRGQHDKRLDHLKRYGWRINELNLSTLPEHAPKPARLLARRILLESRRRTLVEWLSLVKEDGRIHGKFVGIGAWTHRMAHQNPNTANIPREFKEDGSVKLLGKEMRELWIAPKGKLLVGVDAEGIQLRIFAHYINDEEFTNALVKGRKSDKSDPHSLNQRVLGSSCKTRQAAKRFVYALLLGGGLGKLSNILEADRRTTEKALDRLLLRYKGFAHMRETVFPTDAERGWFIGLDGRHVQIPGETVGDRKHLAMSGYLQNGEAIIIKRAAIIASGTLHSEENLGWKFVDIVHDELQSECINKYSIAERVAQIKADAIRQAGEYYSLKCPMAGSWWNDDTNKPTIGTNWYQTH